MCLTTPLRLKIPANQGGFVKGGLSRGVLKIGRACGANLASCGGVYARRRRKFFGDLGPSFTPKTRPRMHSREGFSVLNGLGNPQISRLRRAYTP